MRKTRAAMRSTGIAVSLLGLVLVAVVFPMPSAGAFVTMTELPLSGFGAMVVDGANEHVFVSGGPGSTDVVELDFSGNIVGTLAGIPGARGMALNGSSLYIAASEGSRIEKWDVATLPATKVTEYSTAPFTEPLDLTIAGGRLWFTLHCGQWTGQLASMAMDGTDIAELPTGSEFWTYCPTMIVSPQAPNLIFLMPTGIHPGTLYEYDVGSGSAVKVVESDFGWGPFEWSDIGVMPDGTTFVMDTGNGWGLSEYQMSDMSGPIATYSGVPDSATDGIAVAVSAAGMGQIAASTRRNNETLIQAWDVGTFSKRRSWVLPDDPFRRGLAFSPDGLKLFAATYSRGHVVFNVLTGSGNQAHLMLTGAMVRPDGMDRHVALVKYSSACPRRGRACPMMRVDVDADLGGKCLTGQLQAEWRGRWYNLRWGDGCFRLRSDGGFASYTYMGLRYSGTWVLKYPFRMRSTFSGAGRYAAATGPWVEFQVVRSTRSPLRGPDVRPPTDLFVPAD